jgi:hypothetical protein
MHLFFFRHGVFLDDSTAQREAALFDAEREAGFAFMQSLTPHQQIVARVSMALPRELITIAHVDNLELPYAERQ